VIAVQGSDDLPRAFNVSHEVFDELAPMVTEAALNKKGRETVTLPARDVKTHDHILGMEVLGVRSWTAPATGKTWTQMVFSKESLSHEVLQILADRIIKVERPIQ
jgi:hypothetical protein